MFRCQLCLCNRYKDKPIPLNKELNAAGTVADALNLNFAFLEAKVFEGNKCICSICYTALKKFHDFLEDVKKKHELEDSLKFTVKYEEFDKQTVEIVELPPFEENFVDVKNFEVEDDDNENSSMKTESESEEAEDDKEEKEVVKWFERISVFARIEQARQRAQEERKRASENKQNIANRKKIYEAGNQKISEYVDVKCNLCNLPFEKFSLVSKHFKTAHPDKKSFLVCCGKRFTKRSMLLYHIETHIHPENFKCTICNNKSFQSTWTLKQHMSMMHTGSQVPATCEVCERTFVNELALKNHKPIHFVDPDRVFECYKCANGKYYGNITLLKRHFHNLHRVYNSDRDEGSYVCEVCSKCFTGKQKKLSFYYHMKRHKEQEIIKRGEGIKCSECDKVFGNQNTLKKHLKWAHTPGNDKFMCEICSRKFKVVGQLKGHILAVHTEVVNRLPCHICGNLLKNEKQLANHIRKHSEVLLNLTCKECGHKAKSKNSLWGHMRYSHKLQRNLPCKYCPKMLKTDLDLKEHEATHTGVDLYKCDFCPKSFKFSASYRGHRKREHPEEYELAKPKWMAPGTSKLV